MPQELGGKWPYAGIGGRERADYGPSYEELEAEFGGEAPPRRRRRRGIRRWKSPEEVMAPEEPEVEDWEEEEEKEAIPRRWKKRWGRTIAKSKVEEPEFEYELDAPEFLGPPEEKEPEFKEPEGKEEEERFALSPKEIRPKTDWSSRYEMRMGMKPERTWKRHRKLPYKDI
ncbi:hypothetical protein DRO91_07110 [Candidatus Heimdallarchaeota archaeon]|nr:MAG: hypothetical protein DRO91_07110 [Candidatus Heimdallarchaeota archaeon]